MLGASAKGASPFFFFSPGLTDGHAVQILTNLDSGCLERLKRLGADVAAEDHGHARGGHALGGFNARALRHGLGGPVVEVGSFHRLGIHDDETARPPEARVHHIVERRAFAGNGNFLHVKLLVRLVRLGLGRQDGVSPAFDAQCPSVDERIGHGSPGFGQRAAEGVARNAHPFGAFSGGEPFQIGKAQGFQTFNGQQRFREFGHGDPARLEIGHVGLAFDVATISGPCHVHLRIMFK